MLYLRPQRVYKPSAASQYNSDDYLAHLLDQMDESLYRLRLETPRGTSITEDNSQITCYAHIFDKGDGTELTDLLKGRGWRPTWLLDDKPIDSARISEEGYLLTLETTHLPAIYQTVTLQARDTDILLALTDEAQDKAWLQHVIASGDFPTHLLQASEKLLDIHYLDKLRIDGIEIVKQELSKEIAANATALEELNKHPLTVSQDGYWRIWDALNKTYVTTEYQSRGEKGEPGDTGATGAKGDKGDKGERGERGYRGYQGDKGATGDKGDKGDKGEAGHSPSPEEVLATDDFGKRLGGEVTKQVQPVKDTANEAFKRANSGLGGLRELNGKISTATTNITNLQTWSTQTDSSITSLKDVALTPDTKDDITYLTKALQVLKSGDNGTLEGLALQRIIALSGDNQTVSAYIASQPMETALKAGITDFGQPTERERVAINHNGTGHLGNLYFTGSQIDFRTSWDANPYLSIGAEESQFIDNFITSARIDDTPVSVSSVTLTTSTTKYERTVDVAYDGTRLTVSIGDLNVETYQGATTRLTLDDEVLAEWRGTISVSRGRGSGIDIEPLVRENPYIASNLSYERVVKAGRHTLRIEIINSNSEAKATVQGLRVRRRYDTGRQQSVLTKSGLRLFSAPDRYLDVDYRKQYYQPPGYGLAVGWTPNPYTVRVKGGAKIDRLAVDKIEGAGAKLSPIVTPLLGLGGLTTLYPKYDEWVLTSDARDQYISFSGLSAEIGKSIYIQTRRKAYLYVNGHSFFGLPSVSDNQWLTKNTTYRFVRAEGTAWVVTASQSPYPWT